MSVRTADPRGCELADGPVMETPVAVETAPMEETEATLFALARAVEQRDQATWGHCERLALISVTLGMAMGLERNTLVALYRGAYLHDVGKVGIPDSILNKEGKLTSSEWVVMQTHCARGEDICRHMRSLEPVLPIIRHHHERWDGTGYPDKLKGEQIPLLARVVQVADIYDALTSRRSYKEAYGTRRALGVLQEEAVRGWRDPKLTALFCDLHDDVISYIARFSEFSDSGSERKRHSLLNLNQFLSWEA